MAIAIKSIPVLEGNAAERFNMMADNHHDKTVTTIPENMMERSKNFKLKRRK